MFRIVGELLAVGVEHAAQEILGGADSSGRFSGVDAEDIEAFKLAKFGNTRIERVERLLLTCRQFESVGV